MASVGGDEDSVALNIMPMLDIFSILILFLLMNFSTEPVSHDLHDNLELPESDITVSLDEKPTIVISKKEIRVNERKIADVIKGSVRRRDLSQGGIAPLYKELHKISKAEKQIIKDKKNKKESILTIEMDKSLKFGLLKKALLSAQQADFVKFKLMVSKQLD